MITAVSFIGGIVGLYAAYYLSAFIFNLCAKNVLCDIPYKRIKDAFSNIRHNFIFLISAAAYFLLQFSDGRFWQIGYAIAVVLWSIIISQIGSVLDYSKKSKLSVKILSVVSAAGTCWYSFCHFMDSTSKVSIISKDMVKYIGIVCTFAAVYFTYICILFVFNKISECFYLLKDFKIYEVIIYCILIAATVCKFFIYAVY